MKLEITSIFVMEMVDSCNVHLRTNLPSSNSSRGECLSVMFNVREKYNTGPINTDKYIAEYFSDIPITRIGE